VPQQDPAHLRVKDQTYTWRKGEDVLADNIWEHEVINHCKDRRLVLFVDMRGSLPLPLDALEGFVEMIVRIVSGKHVVKIV
jgi:aspartyl/asparaginyl beta-hydroxylase (cupin superfamily)